MKENQKKLSKLHKTVLIAAVLIVAAMIVIAAVMAGSGVEPKAPENVQPFVTEVPADPALTGIETPYLTLQFPANMKENMVHEQEVSSTATNEVFYMLTGDVKTPVYRIEFGDDDAGEWLGVLQTETGAVPVTYTVFSIDSEELTKLGEGAADRYAALMNAFNTMLDSVYSDSRFSSEKPLPVGEDQETVMTYWTITLPSSMTCSESNENGYYQATFFGEVRGEQTALYRIRIGGQPLQTVLGTYQINATAQTVSLESSDLNQYTNWSDEERGAAYQMMDTINLVIEKITSSDLFAEVSE